MKTNLWAACLLYSEASFNFYMLTFYLKYFPGNIFQNSFCFAISDLCAFVLAGVALKTTTIQNGIRFAVCIAFSGGLLYLCLSEQPKIVPVVICLARVGQTMIFNISVMAVSRLFPTQYVSTAYGCTNLVAHVFACLSALVAEIPNPLPFLIFECLLVVAALMTFKITEVNSIEHKSKDQGKNEVVDLDASFD